MQTSGMAVTMPGAQVYQAGAMMIRAAELQITTTEGDRITLSASGTRSVGYAAAGAATGGSSLQAAVFQATASDRVTLTVEGDWSKAELTDLAKVIKAFEHAAGKADARQLLHRLTRPDLDTIGSVAASASTAMVAMSASASMSVPSEQPA